MPWNLWKFSSKKNLRWGQNWGQNLYTFNISALPLHSTCRNKGIKQKILHQNAGFVVEHTGFEPVTSTMRIDLDALSGLSRPQPFKTFLHYKREILPRVSFTLFTPKGEQN